MIINVLGAQDRPWVIDAVVKLAKLYRDDLGNVVFGNLHIVLSDGNCERGHIESCLEQAEEEQDHVGVALAKCLLELTEEEVEQVYESV